MRMVVAVPKTKNKLTRLDIQAAERAYSIWKQKKDELHLTQQKLAEIIGVTQGAISSWFHGYTAIGTNGLLKLAKVLGVEPTDIRPEFEYKAFSDDIPQDIIRIARKLETLPEGVRSDIERTIDTIIDSNYATFLKNAALHLKKEKLK